MEIMSKELNIVNGVAFPVSISITLGRNAIGEVSEFDEVMWSLDADLGNGVAIVGNGTSLASASVDLSNTIRKLRDG